MRNVTLLVLGSYLILVAANASDVVADESSERDFAKEALALTSAQSASYEMTFAENGQVLKREPKPILSWSNPTDGEIYGNVYVWTANHRPHVVASLYKWYSPHTHASSELQSLSQSALRVTAEHHHPWHPKKPGVDFKPVPDAPAPAKSATRRLLQMRQMARRLTARKTDRKGVERQLRLLTQPVYRYGKEGTDTVDGALFALVQGTDPEVWVLIEARARDDEVAWEIAFARMNSLQFVVHYEDKQIWRADVLPWTVVKDRDEPYTTYRSNEPNDVGRSKQ